MIFKEKEEEYYYRYWESEDGQFAIAVDRMLYRRVRILILHRDESGQLWGIQEYPTYHPELVYPLVFEVMESLLDVYPKSGRQWWEVMEKLPLRNKKYLEDKKEDPVYVENSRIKRKEAIALREKYSNNN